MVDICFVFGIINVTSVSELKVNQQLKQVRLLRDIVLNQSCYKRYVDYGHRRWDVDCWQFSPHCDPLSKESLDSYNPQNVSIAGSVKTVYARLT